MRVAVIGAGPSGFYAIQALFKLDPDVRCDLYDRLPTPYGLVRGGVAPDHQKIKSVVRAYQKTASSPRFRFFGNVTIGRDVRVPELLERYDQVVLAVGAQSARRLGIPGEALPGSHSATEFVAWYNGHPDYQDRRFDLDVDDVVVVGMGNVAMDVARILLSEPERLASTDITDTALQALRDGTRRRVHVLGRRGPVQAAYTPREIQEIAALDGVDVRTKKGEATPDPLSLAWMEAEGRKSHRDNVDFARQQAGMRVRRSRAELWVRFCCSPVAILGEARVEGVRIEKNRIVERDGRLRPEGTGVFEEIPCGMVLAAVGYRSLPVPDVPFDAGRGIVANEDGQVMDGTAPVDDLYVVGWAKRGPTGLIGTNRADSTEVAKKMVATGVKRAGAAGDPADLARDRVARLVEWSHWEALDALELARGEAKGKVRDKLTDVDAMLAHLED